MRITFCGTRGSAPAPGPEFVRYGGDTSCVAVGPDEGPPTLLLDAGTGLRRVGRLLPHDAPFRGAVLLTHLHWDHTQGLPFFAAADRPGARVDVHLPAQGVDPEELLSRAMSPPHFPIRPGELVGDWRFHEIGEGTTRLAGQVVEAREVPHKGGRTFGYRVTDGTSTIAYIPDHHPVAFGPGPGGAGAHHPAAMHLADGVDLLVHDAQHEASEFADRRHLGHATVDYAVGLGRAAGVGAVMLFHHDPARTDGEMDRLVASARRLAGALPVAAATSDLELHLPAAPTGAHDQPDAVATEARAV